MNIIKIDKNNQVNGDGLRCVLWCAGCNHHCKGCHNPETWDPKTGNAVTDQIYDELKEQLDQDEISGVTFTGGEATFPSSREEATKIRAWIKEHYPSKTIWVYTGYIYEDIKDLPRMQYIDVLVDGPYIAEKNPGPNKLKWRGSSNQRVIDVKETRKQNKIVWLIDFDGRPIFENDEK